MKFSGINPVSVTSSNFTISNIVNHCLANNLIGTCFHLIILLIFTKDSLIFILSLYCLPTYFFDRKTISEKVFICHKHFVFMNILVERIQNFISIYPTINHLVHNTITHMVLIKIFKRFFC